MDFSVEERRIQLKSLRDFITSIESQTSSIGKELGWSTEHTNENSQYTTQQGVELVACPENSAHRVPRGTLGMHVEKCRWRKEGYLDDDVPLPACTPDQGTHGKCIQIGKEEQMAVFREASLHNPSLNINCAGQRDDRPAPRTWWRWVADFSADERRVLYDYAVSRTARQAPVKLEDLAVSFQKDKKQAPKSELEQLAEERDAKRRRVSQRSKKVHTNRKSQTEILREVILNQMEVLEDLQKQASNVNPEKNGDGHGAGPHDGAAVNSSAGESQTVDGSGRSEETAPGVSGSLKRAVICDYREDSPWRMLEREGRNPYVRENWERVYEKYYRRNRSYEQSPSVGDHREVGKDERGRYGRKHHDVSSARNHQKRDGTDRHVRRSGEESRDGRRDDEPWKLSRDTKGRSSYDGGRHRRYYGGEGRDGSGRSLDEAPRGRSPQRQRSVGRSKPASVGHADEARAQYDDETFTDRERFSEGRPYLHLGGGDGSSRRTYDRCSERARRASRSEDRNDSSERMDSDKRSRPHSRHHKKKKKKHKHHHSSSSDSRETSY